MNFKKNWKRFWTLSRAHEGFTLVELIVVIAIMAILAGVAVPAYTGYIKKAEKAGDLQLLGAVNTAFAAAVMDEEQISATSLPNGSVTFNMSTDPYSLSKYDEAFQVYFAGNTGKFKVIKSLVLQGGVFVDPADVSEITLSYNGKTITISGEDLAKVADSTYGSVIGATALLTQVNDVATLASGMILTDGSTFQKMVLDPTYSANLAKSLGFVDEAGNADTDALEAYIAEKGVPADKFLANSLVLTTAQATAGKTATEVSALLTGDTFVTDLKTKLDSEDPEVAKQGLSEAALAYGMYTSYVYANGTEEEIAGLSSITDYNSLKTALNSVNSEKFDSYMEGQGKKDLDAYLGAMNVINDGTKDNPEAAKEILTNGFTDTELVNLLGGIMKK